MSKNKDFPWKKYYKDLENKISFPNYNLYQVMVNCAKNHPYYYAYDYLGTKVTFQEFLAYIDDAAIAFRSLGVRRGDVVSILLPNVPEALVSLYALNKIGAIVEMIHPLSSEVEIKNYLNNTGSVLLIMVDFCYEKVKNIIHDTMVYKTIVCSVSNSMPMLTTIGYEVTKGYKMLMKKPFRRGDFISWPRFMGEAKRYKMNYTPEVKGEDPAVILHSGGTTGSPKSIVLSNNNFNALMAQVQATMTNRELGDVVLGILPIFHGFGLGVTMHCALSMGMEVVLVPQFDAKSFGKLISKYRPNLIVGVPTLFEALTNISDSKLDLSSLKYVISGGDTLTYALTRKINDYIMEHKGTARVCQGYGMTEALGAVSYGYREEFNKETSIGIPLPGDDIKIFKPNTQTELPYGEVGEICISGPTVMMGYLDNEKETNEILQLHKDGKIWLHSGDMGMMDNDGVLFYKQRMKRMIVSSGFNVYPNQIENVILSHEAVLNCTVVGIPHPYKQQVAKAVIVLKSGISPSHAIKSSIKELCEKNLAKFSQPYEYEFRKSLPKTLIGKVDFRKLQEEDEQKEEEYEEK